MVNARLDFLRAIYYIRVVLNKGVVWQSTMMITSVIGRIWTIPVWSSFIIERSASRVLQSVKGAAVPLISVPVMDTATRVQTNGKGDGISNPFGPRKRGPMNVKKSLVDKY